MIKRLTKDRQLEAYQRILATQTPVTDKLAYAAEAFDNQTAWNYQNGNASTAVTNDDYGNDYYVAGPSATTVNYDRNNDYYHDGVNNQFAADGVYHTSFNFASDQYQCTINKAAVRYQEQDMVTDQLTSIIDPKMKKEESQKKKKAANRL